MCFTDLGLLLSYSTKVKGFYTEIGVPAPITKIKKDVVTECVAPEEQQARTDVSEAAITGMTPGEGEKAS